MRGPSVDVNDVGAQALLLSAAANGGVILAGDLIGPGWSLEPAMLRLLSAGLCTHRELPSQRYVLTDAGWVDARAAA